MNEIVGLTNVVSAQPRNIFDLGNDLGYEFSKLLLTIKAAEMLDLVSTPGENVLLTETGRRFLTADVSADAKPFFGKEWSCSAVSSASSD